MNTLAKIRITPSETSLNGKTISTASITGLYREFVGDYPKFFKMDSLCKLGFIGAELLLKDISAETLGNAAVILFNRNGSLVTDRNYQKTIGEDGYFPSPSLFVYTLANIVTGEIAIRHKIYGETAFYLLDGYDADSQEDIEAIEKKAAEAYLTSSPSLIITGWIDYNSDSDYLADMRIITNNDNFKFTSHL